MFQLFPTEFEQIGGNNGQWWETGSVCGFVARSQPVSRNIRCPIKFRCFQLDKDLACGWLSAGVLISMWLSKRSLEQKRVKTSTNRLQHVILCRSL